VIRHGWVIFFPFMAISSLASRWKYRMVTPSNNVQFWEELKNV